MSARTPDDITAATVVPFDLVVALTSYASLERLDQQLATAYGNRIPGSFQRWVDKQVELKWYEQGRRNRQARALWERVHPDWARVDKIMAECEAALKVASEVVEGPGR